MEVITNNLDFKKYSIVKIKRVICVFLSNNKSPIIVIGPDCK